MRACLVTGCFPPQTCRTADYAERLARQLAELGLDVHVVTGPAPEADCPGVRVHRLPDRGDESLAGAVLAAVQAAEPHVVHVHYPSASQIFNHALSHLPMLMRLRHCRTVLTLHSYSNARPLCRLRQLYMAAWAHHVIATSYEDFFRLRRAAFWKGNRLHCVAGGWDMEPLPNASFDRQSRRRIVGADNQSLLICFLGSLYPGRGIEDLIDAFAIASRGSLNARLVIVGSTFPSQTLFGALLRRRIIDAGLAGKVHFSGFVKRHEISEWLLASDVCVLPFRDRAPVRRESLLTAFRHGLPVITTAAKGLTLDGAADSMMLVSPGDVHKLAESIRMLAASPEALAQMRRKAAECSAGFAWPEIARRTIEIYGG